MVASSLSTKHGTLPNSTDTHLPSRHCATALTGPAGVSTVTSVAGSRIGTIPVSSATVTVQIKLEPDIGTYSVGSMMMTPKSHSGRVAGTMKLRCRATDPRGSHISSLRT